MVDVGGALHCVLFIKKALIFNDSATRINLALSLYQESFNL